MGKVLYSASLALSQASNTSSLIAYLWSWNDCLYFLSCLSVCIFQLVLWLILCVWKQYSVHQHTSKMHLKTCSGLGRFWESTKFLFRGFRAIQSWNHILRRLWTMWCQTKLPELVSCLVTPWALIIISSKQSSKFPSLECLFVPRHA